MKKALLTLVLLSGSAYAQVVYDTVILPNRFEVMPKGYCDRACWDAKKAPPQNTRIALIPRAVELPPVQGNQPLTPEQQKKMSEMTK